MRKLFYMGLESYEARYTLQLTEWNRRVFDRRGLDVVYVPGTTIDDTKSISVGQVLDCLLYTSPSPRDGLLSRMPSSA